MITRDSTNIREEEVKNRLRQDFFQDYDATPVLGDVDFAVAVKSEERTNEEKEYLLWAEAKKGRTHDIYESLAQLILTIGRARTFDTYTPPKYLGAFDAEKICFVPYEQVMDVFSQSNFNWRVAPSDHASREFQQLLRMVKPALEGEALLYHLEDDSRELSRFIRHGFKTSSSASRIRISKSNFIHIYQKWVKAVMPSINIDWQEAKAAGVYGSDFYLADILSSEDNRTLKEKLNILLKTDHYELKRSVRDFGLSSYSRADFNDRGVAHAQFWRRYQRPPREEYWDYIIGRKDLLVPQDIREVAGSYFTPARWVELSQQYLEAELGDNWQDEYTVWDCCAGTGNLLAGLSNKYNVWASTKGQPDVDAIHDRIAVMNESAPDGANLLDDHVFEFDFLEDTFDQLPPRLREVVEDAERRRRLVIYINPPYVEGDNVRGTGRRGSGDSRIKLQYADFMGYAKREKYIQFLARIYNELPGCRIAYFSTLKDLQAPKFGTFRQHFLIRVGRMFVVPADTFDNVSGDFPISFKIVDTVGGEQFVGCEADVYAADGTPLGRKAIASYDGERFINDWTRTFIDPDAEKRKDPRECIATVVGVGNDFQNQRGVFIERPLRPWNHKYQWQVTRENLVPSAIYLAVRKAVDATWLNDRDQFLFPRDGWQTDRALQADALVFALFANNIRSGDGPNRWIPYREAEVGARNNFQSHFMHDFLQGRLAVRPPRRDEGTQTSLFGNGDGQAAYYKGDRPVALTPEAEAVLAAGRELWRHYHRQPDANPDASFMDIKDYFRDHPDTSYTQLVQALRQAVKALAAKIEPKVYEYGFLTQPATSI